MLQKVILVTSDRLGTGDEELGKQVLETFFNLLKQREELPAAIFCMNEGVFALTEQSFASLHIKEISQKGVKVYACKTCVDYYNVEQQLITGEISSMGHFLDLASKYEVITI